MPKNSNFKPIRNYEGYYECDENGNIYSLRNNHGKIRVVPYKLKYEVIKHKLEAVLLSKEATQVKHPVGRIICLTFHGEPEDSNFIAHYINGDTFDHRPLNLKWVSRSSVGTGRYPGYDNYSIKKWNQNPNTNKLTKLSKEIVIEIFEMLGKADHPPFNVIAKKYGVTASHIANIKAGRVWGDVTSKL